jgi:phospholipid/cholesterol/gamma-HCH transport system substrate-binding protein
MARNICFTNELRVGIMFLTGLILLVLVFVTLTRWRQDRGTYFFFIRFTQVQGLQSGAEVRVAGVKVGFVESIELLPPNNLVNLRVRVQEDVVVYSRDLYTIGIGGLVGERFVEINPVSGDRGIQVQEGTVVSGFVQPDINEVIANANTLVNDLKSMTIGLNEVLGDPRTQENLRASIANLRTTTDNAARLTGTLNRTLTQSEASVNLILANVVDVSSDLRAVSDTLTPQLRNTDMVKNLEVASANVARITTRVDNLITTVGGILEDKELAASLRKVLANLQQASTDLQGVTAQAKTASAALPRITANLETASADIPKITKPFVEVAPETAQNVLAISQRLRRTSEQVGDIAEEVTKASEILIETRAIPEARLMGITHGAPSPRSDLNVDIRLRDNMLRAGVADIGRSSKFNLQFGNRVGSRTWVRYGLVESRFGLGADYAFNPNARLSTEFFDPGDPRANALFDLRLRPLGDNFWLTTGWYNLLGDTSLGIGLTFREDSGNGGGSK